jgi:histone-lysine N-methyltransferase SETMAR
MVIEYRKVTYEEIRERLNIGASAVYTILHDRLGLRKVLSRWVPHKLSDEQKQQRLEICRKNLKWLSESGSQVISKIITGDETYVYFYEGPTRH